MAEKLLRVVHLAAFLVGLLAHDGQKIFWMSDHDAICPNKEMHDHALSLFQRLLGIYTRPHCTYPVLGGALPFAERSLEMTDLLSAADVVAGSVAQYLTKLDSQRHEDISVKDGSDSVLCWLAQDGVGLKKITFLLRRARNGGVEAGTVEFDLVNPPPDTLLVPIVM